MNAQLKGILEKAWNEPRHFFFWLTFFSLCGLGLAVLLALLSEKSIGLFAIGCALGIGFGCFAFMLAWISPVRRWFSWLLRRRFLVLVGLVTLIALFYAIENWRGHRAWNEFRRTEEAKGEKFELTQMMPPPVRDEDNFFAAPLWSFLYFTQTNHQTIRADTNWSSKVLFDIHGPNQSAAPRLGSLEAARRVDLAEWQAFYRGSNNLFAAVSTAGEAVFTNYFPIADVAQSPAADVLLALSRFDSNRLALQEAARRPSARFWINYDAGFGVLLPHLAKIRGCAQYLALHATAALAAGDNQTALEDLRLSFRLLEAIRSEPILISHLVRISALHIALSPIAEGLSDQRWTEAELIELERELAGLDFLADYQFAMRGERAFSLWGVDYIRRSGGRAWGELMNPEHSPSNQGVVERTFGATAFALIPDGWFDQNKLALSRIHANYILPLVEAESRMVPPAASRAADEAITNRSPRPNPYDLFSQMLLPALTKTAERTARAQNFVDLARVAIALERHRLTQGKFPDSLEALTPRFLAPLPSDVINGDPLHYRVEPEGGFVLYSVGWNEVDDGGQIFWTKGMTPRVDSQTGDWVWRHSEKPAAPAPN